MINKKILILIIVQYISLFGTHMSDFAVGLYLYEKSGSLFEYSLFSLLIIVPEILLSPIIGMYVDRYNKKILMLIGHGGAGISTVLLLILINAGYENVYVFLLLVSISSVFNALIFVSFNVLLGSEIAKNKMHIIAAIIQFGLALVVIVSPCVSALLLENYGLKNIFYIDILTFTLALTVIYLLKFKFLQKNNNITQSVFRGFKDALFYLKNNSLLLLNLILFIFMNFAMSIVSVNIAPLVLNIGTTTDYGAIMSIGGFGLAVGSVIMIFFKTQKYNFWMNRFAFLQATVLFLAVIDLNLAIIAFGSFLFMIFSSMIGTLNYTYWQNEINTDLKGRLFGLRNSVMGLSLLMGYILSAPLSQWFSKSILEKMTFFQIFFENLFLLCGFYIDCQMFFLWFSISKKIKC